MEKSSVKKIAFWIGIIFHIIVIIGFIYVNDWYIDGDLFGYTIKDNDATPFAILSLFGTGIMIYGLFTPVLLDSKKNSIKACIISAFIWLYLIICLFSDVHHDSFYLNWFLLSISATTLLVFAVKNLIKKEV